MNQLVTSIKISIPLFGLMLLLLAGCKRKGCMDELANNYDPKAKKEGSCTYDDFDRSAFIANYADNIISLQYQNFAQQIQVLSDDFTVFKTSPSESNINTLRQNLEDVYIAWQEVSTYEFGVAENISWRLSANTYPTDSSKIESNVQDGTFNLDAANQLDASGLPALDYLFNHFSAPEILIEMTNQNRLDYTQAIIDKLQEESQLVSTEFSTNYISTFKAAEGTDAGSALSLLVNNFNKDLEILKNAQLGIPLGKKTLGIIMPEQTQGYYGALSRDLLSAHMQSMLVIFKGGSDLGLDDYLNFIGAMYGSENLSTSIINQIETCQGLIDASNTPISQAVSSEYDQLDDLYTEIQKLIVLTKTDMPSALGVLITYQDNDGD